MSSKDVINGWSIIKGSKMENIKQYYNNFITFSGGLPIIAFSPFTTIGLSNRIGFLDMFSINKSWSESFRFNFL